MRSPGYVFSDRQSALVRSLRPAAVALLVAAHVVLALSASSRMSPTYDEGVYVTAGYSYWAFHDFRLQPENGILPQRYLSLPVYLSSGFRFPSRDSEAWRQSDLWTLGDQFLFRLGNDLDAILMRGRTAIALVGAAVCLLVYRWSKELYGTGGGLLSLALCALCPTMLAHSGLMTSDMTVTLFMLLSVHRVWKNLQVVSLANVALGCLSVTGLFLSKLSAASIIPMAGLMVGALLISNRPMRVVNLRGASHELKSRAAKARACSILIVAYVLVTAFLVWTAYEFRYSAFADHGAAGEIFYKFKSIRECCSHLGGKGAVIEWLSIHRLLPEAYLYGAAFLLMHLSRYEFWNGAYSTDGWTLFFPYCFLVKTPLPVLALAGTSGAIGIRRAMKGLAASRLYETVPLWCLILVFSATSLLSTLNIGHRHILPLYPALFILCGSAAGWMRSEKLWLRGLFVVLVSLFVVETGRAYPHYLAYFNQITGRTHAYRHLVDSSLDWGQDLPGLKQWLARHGWDGSPERRVYLTYFGTADPAYYGINASPLPVDKFPPTAPPLRPGLYCVSATALQCVYAQAQGAWSDKYEASFQILKNHMQRARQIPLSQAEKEVGGAEKLRQLGWTYYMLSVARLMAYLRQQEPLDSIGFSILLFQLSADDLNRALNEPLPDRDGARLGSNVEGLVQPRDRRIFVAQVMQNSGERLCRGVFAVHDECPADMRVGRHVRKKPSEILRVGMGGKPGERFNAGLQFVNAVEDFDGGPSLGDLAAQRVLGLKSDQYDCVPLVLDRVLEVVPHSAVLAHSAGGNHHEGAFAPIQLHAVLRRLDVGQHGKMEKIPIVS
jgi:Dolichyl-phosphate-mannose-protein mannosyltransferase